MGSRIPPGRRARAVSRGQTYMAQKAADMAMLETPNTDYWWPCSSPSSTCSRSASGPRVPIQLGQCGLPGNSSNGFVPKGGTPTGVPPFTTIVTFRISSEATRMQAGLTAMELALMNEQKIAFGRLHRPLGVETCPGVVLVHDVWGLSDHYRDLARRLEESRPGGSRERAPHADPPHAHGRCLGNGGVVFSADSQHFELQSHAAITVITFVTFLTLHSVA